MSGRTRYLLIGLTAWILGLSWALSSPVASSPDDDFHLASIYCATGNTSLCTDVDGDGPGTVVEVPAPVFAKTCFASSPQESGACTEDFPPGDVVQTNHYNHAGLYPSTYYAVMSRFAGPDVERSVLVIRLVALTCALGAMTLAAWSNSTLRDSQLVAWSVTAVPMGMFLFPSTNPSGWGIAGVAALWPAAHAMFHATGVRNLALAIAATTLAAVLATSRGDTAGIAAGVLALVTIAYARSRKQVIAVGTVVVLVLLCGLALLNSGQSDTLEEGLVGAETSSGIPLLWNNLLKVPELWAGNFGVSWGLGWLDTSMPGLVWLPAVAVVSGLVLLGLRDLRAQRAIMLAGTGAVLFIYPLLILQRSGAAYPSQFQPRYLLPVVFVVIGICLSPLDGPRIRLTWPQRWIVTVGAIVAASVALHVELRRYVTGTDVSSPNLGAGAEWSYADALGPMAVWIMGGLAAAVLFVLVIGLLRARQAVSALSDQPDPEMATVR